SSLTESLAILILSLSLHDALPIFDAVVDVAEIPAGFRSALIVEAEGDIAVAAQVERVGEGQAAVEGSVVVRRVPDLRCVAGYAGDRKSTRLNSSHVKNSYAVFCLK